MAITSSITVLRTRLHQQHVVVTIIHTTTTTFYVVSQFQWRMSQVDKTCYTVFSKSNVNQLSIQLNGIDIKRVNSCRYLGVIIDCELKWKEHIEYIYKKLVKYSSIFYKLRNILPSSCLRSIYYAFVHPHILYGIEIYANTFSTYLKPLNVLNNKLLRILQNCRLQTPVAHLYREYQTLPINQLFILQIINTCT